MKNALKVMALAAAAGALAGCGDVRPPGDPGVCYEVTFANGKIARYVKLADHVDKLEDCAGKLESIRMNFLHMGGSVHELSGAFSDQFLFLDGTGVYASRTLTGPRYVLMARTYDGRLVRPGYTGATPQGQ